MSRSAGYAESGPDQPYPYPWLVYSHGKGNKDQIFCTITNPKKTYHRRIPNSQNKEYLGSCFGWCVCSYSSTCIFLWNPITLEKITLPSLKTQQSIAYSVLSSPPTESATSCCMVILFAKEFPMIIYCVLGDEEWTELDYYDEFLKSLVWYRYLGSYPTATSRHLFLLICPVWCNGDLYAMTVLSQDILVKIHLSQRPNTLNIKFMDFTVPNTPPYSFCSYYHNLYLVESCGQLFRIEIQHKSFKYVVAIEVHGFDFSEQVFSKVESTAKDRAFFVNLEYGWAFSYPAYRPEIDGGRVYFTLAHDGHKNLYSYNIEDKDISVSSPFLNLPTLLHSSPIWVMPNLRLANTPKEAQHCIHIEEQHDEEVHLKDLKETNDTKEVHLPCLPFDLIESMFQHLFLVDYLHLRATSKMFHSAFPPIQWRIASQRFENPSLSPWLAFVEKDGTCAFIDPKFGDKYFINLPQRLKKGNVICSTKDGWLLLKVGHRSLFLFNPFKQVIIRLPFTESPMQGFSCIGFSSSSSSSECVVVEIQKHAIPLGSSPGIYVKYCTMGEVKWHFAKVVVDDDVDLLFNDNNPVFYKGKFYYLGLKGNLGILEINDEVVYWTMDTEPKQPCTGYIQNFLLECDGELLSVFVGHLGKWVRVFKLNESKMTWIRVESLGNYMLYVSRLSSFSVKAKIPGMENKIYFSRFYGQNIVFYSLETGKYHSKFESKDIVDFYSSREKLYCCWIEPRWC